MSGNIIAVVGGDAIHSVVNNSFTAGSVPVFSSVAALEASLSEGQVGEVSGQLYQITDGSAEPIGPLASNGEANTLAELFATDSPSHGDIVKLVNASTGALVGVWRYSTILHDLGVWVPRGIIWIKNAGLQGETIFGVATDAWPSVNGGAGSSAFTWVAGGLQFSWGSPAPKAAWEWPLVSRPIDWSRIQAINLMSRWDKSYVADFVGYCGEWDDANATGNRTIVGLLGATNQYGVLFGPWRVHNAFSGQPDKLVGSYNRSNTNVGCGASCMFDGGTKAQASTHSTQNHEAGDTLTNFGVYINATGGVSTNVWEACQFDIVGYSE